MAYTQKGMTQTFGNTTATTVTKLQDNGCTMIPANGPFGNKTIGPRTVIVMADPLEWNEQSTYEYMTLVLSDGNSYISKKDVPAGTPVTNSEYWVKSSDWNAQLATIDKNMIKYNHAMFASGSFDSFNDIELNVGDIVYVTDRGLYTVISEGAANGHDIVSTGSNILQYKPYNGTVRVSELGYEAGDNIDNVFAVYNGVVEKIHIDGIGFMITKPIIINQTTEITGKTTKGGFYQNLTNLVWGGSADTACISTINSSDGLTGELNVTSNVKLNNLSVNAGTAKVGMVLYGACEVDSESFGNLGVYGGSYGVVIGHNWTGSIGSIRLQHQSVCGVYGDNSHSVVKPTNDTSYDINNMIFKDIHANYSPNAVVINNGGTGNVINTIEVEHYTDCGVQLSNNFSGFIGAIYTETASVIEGTKNFNYDFKSIPGAKFETVGQTIGYMNGQKFSFNGDIVVLSLHGDPEDYRPLAPKPYVYSLESTGNVLIVKSNVTVDGQFPPLNLGVTASTLFTRDAGQLFGECAKGQSCRLKMTLITSGTTEDSFSFGSSNITIDSTLPSGTVVLDRTITPYNNYIDINKTANTSGGYYLATIYGANVPTYQSIVTIPEVE